MISMLFATLIFAAPAPKSDFCGTLKKVVAAADKADGFSESRGAVSAKDPSGAPNAWISTLKIPGAQKCWVLADGAMVECDFAAGNERAAYTGIEGKVHACLKGHDWKDSSIGFGANGGPKVQLAKGRTSVTVEIVPAAGGDRAHPRLTVFQPPKDDDGTGLLDDE